MYTNASPVDGLAALLVGHGATAFPRRALPITPVVPATAIHIRMLPATRMGDMSTSRAVLLLGMHRSGTTAVARGRGALSVYLGNDFLDAQPENPTGYWEDKGIVALNERLLGALGLTWDDTSPIDRRAFERRRVRALRRDAIRYLNRTFTPAP